MTDYALYYGSSRKPLLFVVADAKFPEMYRVKWHDGRLSDLLNLSRACEAGRVAARNHLVSSHEPNDLCWQKHGERGAA